MPCVVASSGSILLRILLVSLGFRSVSLWLSSGGGRMRETLEFLLLDLPIDCLSSGVDNLRGMLVVSIRIRFLLILGD
jgi:hypothetical protein